MSKLSIEELFIIKKLEQNEGKLNYKDLQTLCQEEFEGVRLILKKLKEKQIVSYDGIIPGYSSEIILKEAS